MTDADGGSASADFEDLLIFLNQTRGFDFTGYKRGTLTRRIDKRMQEVGVDSYAEYRDHLEVDVDEWERLFDTILINVTSFFRDPEAWEFLAAEIIPEVVEAAGDDEIRIWSAGCASGEEAYSLAAGFAEALGPAEFSQRVKIYATDVDESALEEARRGTYTAEQLEAVPDELRSQYFTSVDGGGTFRAELRRSVIFGRHDLTQDAPISRLDLLVCRNTLMYFNGDTQAEVLRRLHFALKDTGYLFLGRAEMLLSHHRLFTPAHPEHRVFEKVRVVEEIAPALIADGTPGAATPSADGVFRVLERAVDGAPMVQILVDADGTVVAANRLARSVFGLSPRDVGRPLRDLEVSYRPADLRTPIERANDEGRTVELNGVEARSDGDSSAFYDIIVTPLSDDEGAPLGVSVCFVDVTDLRVLQLELVRSKEDLETANEELQSTNEELETTNEELQSTNEELETTNEELQSSNEELETMNEELHSTNEQLESVNDTLHERTEALDRAKEFMESILTSMSAAVVVLDSNLVVQMWNDAAEDLWGLAAERVVGRAFFTLDIGLPVDALREPIRRCLDTKVDTGDDSGGDEVVLDASDRRGTGIRCRVTSTLLLYGDDDERRGVVLLMEPTGTPSG